MNASDRFTLSQDSGPLRRFGLGALAITVVAVALEALFLDPSWLEARRSSFLAVLTLALQQAKPYLVISFSAAACGWTLTRFGHRLWLPAGPSWVFSGVGGGALATAPSSRRTQELSPGIGTQ